MFFSKKVWGAFITLSLSLLLPLSAHAAAYKVTSGDTLYQIGSLFKTTATTIMKTNSLSSSAIYPGQVLRVPGDTYTVKSGDSLYSVANRYGIPLYSLKKANNEWDNYLYVGQKLALPGVVSGQASSTANGGSGARAAISYTASDLDLIARLIRAEAEGQPYQAKVGVGAVIVNRVKSADFPNTISGVIYQKNQWYYQFTPVENGWINRAATEDDINAAYAALHGSDPTKGALFYFDDSATNKWLWSKPIALRSGNMVFTY